MLVITTLTKEEWIDLLKNHKLNSSHLNHYLTADTIQSVKDYYKDYIEFDVTSPIVGVSKLNNHSVQLLADHNLLPGFVEVYGGCVVVELEVDSDLPLQVEFSNIRSSFNLSHKSNGSFVSAILPYIDLSWVTKYWELNDCWELNVVSSSVEDLQRMKFDV